jgi:hypothetical protein
VEGCSGICEFRIDREGRTGCAASYHGKTNGTELERVTVCDAIYQMQEAKRVDVRGVGCFDRGGRFGDDCERRK